MDWLFNLELLSHAQEWILVNFEVMPALTLSHFFLFLPFHSLLCAIITHYFSLRTCALLFSSYCALFASLLHFHAPLISLSTAPTTLSHPIALLTMVMLISHAPVTLLCPPVTLSCSQLRFCTLPLHFCALLLYFYATVTFLALLLHICHPFPSI